ncbi:MAG: peptidoglycan DD-metalloendopeptidase family protein [Candidatus Kerfeldbacteria bacterium]|nr:peptidoglycan DD-metalloendopeptidase family protein [Candidatus Kerfeldbacteria bacterium]
MTAAALVVLAVLGSSMALGKDDDGARAPAGKKSLLEINLEIKEKRTQIDDLRDREDEYQKAIERRQADAVSLQGQLATLDDSIAKTQLNIERSRLEIDQLNLEVQVLEEHIRVQEEDIVTEKRQLGSMLRELNRLDQKSLLEVTVANKTLSDFYDHVRNLERLQRDAKDSLDSLKDMKASLTEQRDAVVTKRNDETRLKEQLEGERFSLEGEQSQKTYLLEETQQSEEKFTNLVQELRDEQQQINGEILGLQNRLDRLSADGTIKFKDDIGRLLWPVTPSQGISAYFHDPTYPFRNIFEHPGIDIPEPQGTNISAAEDGYVLIAKDAGLGYSYIMIAHTDSISTVYGHVSAIYVSEGDQVQRGDVIGAVGGRPGTPGAGRLTTGSHLHFEVRVDGIPVNPLDYLP